MKVLAGREAVAEEAERGAGGERREDAGRVAVEREGDHRQGDAGDHADAGGEAVDAVDQVDHVDHGDDADHGADVAEVDRRRRRAGSARSTGPGSRRPKKGKVKLSTVTPAETGIDHRRDLPEQLRGGGQVEDVVEDADHGDQRPRRRGSRGVSASQGSQIRPATSDRGEDRQPAQLRRRRGVQRALARVVDRADPHAPAGSSAAPAAGPGRRRGGRRGGFSASGIVQASARSGRTRG